MASASSPLYNRKLRSTTDCAITVHFVCVVHLCLDVCTSITHPATWESPHWGQIILGCQNDVIILVKSGCWATQERSTCNMTYLDLMFTLISSQGSKNTSCTWIQTSMRWIFFLQMSRTWFKQLRFENLTQLARNGMLPIEFGLVSALPFSVVYCVSTWH